VGEIYNVFHYGVFLSAQTLAIGQKRLVPAVPGINNQDDDGIIPLPYKVRPEPYSNSNKPWTVDGL
jgi:hypothetical protein